MSYCGHRRNKNGSLSLSMDAKSQWRCDRQRSETFAAMLQWLHLDESLHHQQNTKKLYGTKNNWVYLQLVQFWTKDTKTPQKAQLPLERARRKRECARSKGRVPLMPLQITLPKGWGHHPATLPASPLDTSLLSSHLRNELTLPWRASKEVYCLFSFPPAETPIKSCLNFLPGL